VKRTRIYVGNVGPLTRVDLDLKDPQSGEILSPVALFGINGSGKTILLETIVSGLRSGGVQGRRNDSAFQVKLGLRLSSAEAERAFWTPVRTSWPIILPGTVSGLSAGHRLANGRCVPSSSTTDDPNNGSS